MGWVIAAEADNDEIYAPLKSLRNIIIILSFLALLCIVTVSFFFSDSINRVVNRMKEFLGPSLRGRLQQGHPPARHGPARRVR